MSEKSEREAKKARKQRKIERATLSLKSSHGFRAFLLFDPFSPQSWSLQQANPKVKNTNALNFQAWGTFDFPRDLKIQIFKNSILSWIQNERLSVAKIVVSSDVLERRCV